MKELGCLWGPLTACHLHVPENSRSFSSLCTLVVFGGCRGKEEDCCQRRMNTNGTAKIVSVAGPRGPSLMSINPERNLSHRVAAGSLAVHVCVGALWVLSGQQNTDVTQQTPKRSKTLIPTAGLSSPILGFRLISVVLCVTSRLIGLHMFGNETFWQLAPPFAAIP